MWVVPSQWSADGGWRRAVGSTWVGWYGARTSARAATRMKTPRITRPARDLRFRNIAKAEPSLDQNVTAVLSGACAVMTQASVWRVRGSRNA